MSEVNTQTAETQAPKLTRVEKLTARAETLAKRIAADTEAYNEIAAELNSIALLANLAAGQAVKVKLGRKFADKDTTRIVDAIVVGVRETDEGEKQYKVQYGTGFDAEVAVVGGGSIVEVVQPAAEATAA